MTSVELRQERAKLVADARKLIDNAEAESRSLSAEEQETWDRLMADADKLKEKIDAEERKEYQALVEQELTTSKRKVAPFKPESRIEGSFSDALRSWFLHGTKYSRSTATELDNAAQWGVNLYSPSLSLNLRALTKGTNADGGFTVPTGFVNELNVQLKYYAPFRNFVRVITTENGIDLPWPKVDDTGNKAVIIGEGVDLQEQNNNTFASVTLKAFKYSSKLIKVSTELLRDNAVNLESYLADAIANRIGRAQEEHALVGDNTGKPQGLVPASSLGVTLASQTPTYDEIVDLIHSVDPAYRQRGAFVMHDTFLAKLRKLKDSNGQPLWQPGMVNGQPDTIFGYPYFISNSLDDGVGLSEKPCVFGDLSQYVWRDVGTVEIQRSTERFMELGIVAWVGILAGDGRLVGPSAAVKHVITPAA